MSSQAASQRRLVAHLNANFRDVLKAMRAELGKETRRMEAAMDGRLAAALTASAAQFRVHPRHCSKESSINRSVHTFSVVTSVLCLMRQSNVFKHVTCSLT